MGQNFHVSGKFPISLRKLSWMGRGLHVVTWSHLTLPCYESRRLQKDGVIQCSHQC